MASSRLDEVQTVGAEVIRGAEECFNHSQHLLEELGFPSGILPLKDLEECGLVRETGYVWMKQKAPYEHFFIETNSLVRYDTMITAFVEKGKMKRMSGVKSKQLLLWVPIVEMSMDESVPKKVLFKTPLGIGKSFPYTSFVSQNEEHKSTLKA